MEMSLYQDNDSDKTHHMKKTMQLDFGTDKTKQQKFSNMLQLASPELEKLISHNGMVGTTPTPSQFIYPKYVTDEQEAYARGFVEALAELHQQPGMPNNPGANPPTSMQNNNQQQGQAMMQMNKPIASTYSQLMPMSSSQPTFTSGYNSMNQNSNNMMMNPTVSRRHPPFAPSGLAQQAMPHLPQHPAMQQGASSAYRSVNVKAEPSTSTFSADHQVPHSPSGASSRITDSPLGASDDDDDDDDDLDRVENINRLDSIPVDLEEQEKIKLERKRARNRIAARKCRTRKLERINRLEDKVSDLKTRNNELQQSAHALNNEVVILKQKIMEHINSGCQIMMPEMRMQAY